MDAAPRRRLPLAGHVHAALDRRAAPRHGPALVCVAAMLLTAAVAPVAGRAEERGTGSPAGETGRAEGLALGSLPSAAGQSGGDAAPGRDDPPPARSIDTFLDNLMRAESNGRLEARNPRSTALGPYQFIESTFLAVVKRHFGGEVALLSDEEILALRTNFAFSRRAALAYTRDNAAFLRDQALPVTHANLRLAFLVGPAAAARLLKASLAARAADLLSAQAIAANPFLADLSVADLLEKAARDIGDPGSRIALRAAGEGRPPPAAEIPVRCNLGLASCRRWLALARKRAAGGAGRGASGGGAGGSVSSGGGAGRSGG